MMDELVPVTRGIWSAQCEVRMWSVTFPTRMTVVELDAKRLWIHSPIRIKPQVATAIDDAGEVASVVAPNTFHHMFAGDWAARYPGATLYVAPGMAAKRPDLAHGTVLEAEQPAWHGELQQHCVGGMGKLNEVVFYHVRSKTLICSDIVHNLRALPRRWSRIAWTAIGAYGKFGPSVMEKLATSNRAALRRSIDTILGWDFDRVIMTHGEILPTGGRAALASAYRWLER